MPNWSDPKDVQRWIDAQERKANVPKADVLRGPYAQRTGAELSKNNSAPPKADVLRGPYAGPKPPSSSDVLREREREAALKGVQALNASARSQFGRSGGRDADEFTTKLNKLRETGQQARWGADWQMPGAQAQPMANRRPTSVAEIELPWAPQQVQPIRPTTLQTPEIRASIPVGPRTMPMADRMPQQGNAWSTSDVVRDFVPELQNSLLRQQAEQGTITPYQDPYEWRKPLYESVSEQYAEDPVTRLLTQAGALLTAFSPAQRPATKTAGDVMRKAATGGGWLPDELLEKPGNAAMFGETFAHAGGHFLLAQDRFQKGTKTTGNPLGDVGRFAANTLFAGLEMTNSLNAFWKSLPVPGSADFYGIGQDVTIGQQMQAFGEYFNKAVIQSQMVQTPIPLSGERFGLPRDLTLGELTTGIQKYVGDEGLWNVFGEEHVKQIEALRPIWSMIQANAKPADYYDPLQAKDWIARHLNRGNEIRAAILAAQETDPQIAGRLLPGLNMLTTSGNAPVENFLFGVEHQSDIIAHYNQAGQQALIQAQRADQAAGMSGSPEANQYYVQAGAFFAAAEAEREKTPADYYDENANLWGELIWGLTGDWMNLPIMETLNLTKEAGIAARRAEQIAKISALPEQEAADLVAQAFKVGADDLAALSATAKSAVTGAKPVAATAATTAKRTLPVQLQTVAKNVTSLFERTPETKAHWTTDNAFQAIGQLINGVTDKQTAKALIQWMVNDPAKLITGLTADMAPGIDNLISTRGGKFKVSPSIFLTPEGKDAARVIKAAGEALLNMKALDGAGQIDDLRAFMGEADNIIWATSQKLYGLDPLPFIPNGTDSIRIASAGKKSAMRVIEYLDDTGEVIGKTVDLTAKEAKRIKQEYYKVASAGDKIGSAVGGIWNSQRALLADVYLHLRPGHWVRNATTAMMTLAADGNLNFEPIENTHGYLAAKAGDMIQTPRVLSAVTGGERGMGEGVQGMVGQGSHWSRKIWPKYNPIAATVEAGSGVWTGTTSVAGTGGRIPFGENAFYVKAFKKVMQRYWRQSWPEQVQRAAGTLLNSGIQADLAKSVISTISEAGVNGGKRDVLDVVNRIVQSHYAPVNLADAGLHPETFAPDTWAQLWKVVQDIDPSRMSRQQIEASVRGAVAGDLQNWMKIIQQAPPQPGRVTFTMTDLAKDTATMIEALKSDAMRAGMAPQEAAQVANSAGRSYVEQSRTLLGQLVDLGKEGTPSAASTQLVGSSLLEVNRIYERARAEVDALYPLVASKKITWAEKFQRTQAIYAKVPGQIQDEINRVRDLLPRIQAGETVGAPGWSDVLQRMADYDSQAVQAMRDKGLTIRSAAESPQYKAAIDAGRNYVDNSLSTLYVAFNRFPTTDSLDLVADAMRHIDSLGIQARAMQAKAVDELMLGAINVSEYYTRRNELWYALFNEQAAAALSHSRKILANGFHAMAPVTPAEATKLADETLRAVPEAKAALQAGDAMDEAIAMAEVSTGTVRIPAGTTMPVRDRTYVKQQLQDAFGYSDEQSESVLAILDARAEVYAKVTGKTPASWYADKIGEIRKGQAGEFAQLTQAERGSVSFLDDGRAVISALENPDITTFLHETGHVFRRDLSDIARIDPAAMEDLRRAEKILGVQKGIWTRRSEEAFAQAFEVYVASGKAPVTGLQGVFERLRTWINELWNTVKGRPNIKVSPELRGVFDRLVADLPQTLTADQAGTLRRLAAAAGIGTDKGDWHLINAVAKGLREAGFNVPEGNLAATMKRIDNLPYEQYEQAKTVLQARAATSSAPVTDVSNMGAKGIDPNVIETEPIAINPQPEAGPTVAQLDNAPGTTSAPATTTVPDSAGTGRPADVGQDTASRGSSKPASSGTGTASAPKPTEPTAERPATATASAPKPTEPTAERPPAASKRPATATPVASDPAAYEDANGVRYLSYDRLPKPAQFVTPEKLQDVLDRTGGKWTFMEHQVDNADRALTAFSRGKGFVIADATGTGKTYSGALIAELMFDQGAKRILLVAPNDGLLRQWREVMEPLGMKFHKVGTNFVEATAGDRTVTMATYAGMRSWKPDRLFAVNRWDLVMFDEAHNMKALMTNGSKQAEIGQQLAKNADNVLYLSATPLESVLHYGYMSDALGVDRTFQSAMNALGVQSRYNEQLQRSVWEGLSPQTLARLHHRLVGEGVYVRHEMSFKSIFNKSTGELKHAYTSAVRVPVSANGAEQYRRLNAALDEALRLTGNKAFMQIQALRVNLGKALLEQDKLPVAIEIAKRKVQEGKSVSFFLFRKSAADFDSLFEKATGKAMEGELKIIYSTLRNYGVDLRSPVATLLDAFPDAVKITGDEAAGSALRNANVDAFNQGKSKVSVVTMAAGGTGLSLHDKIGTFPRVQINLTSPYTAMAMEQVAGRTFRMGSQSNAEIYWMFNDLPLERVYSRRVMTRMSEMGAMVRGDEALAPKEDMLEFVFRDAEGGAINELPNAIHASQSVIDLDSVLRPPWEQPGYTPSYAPGYGPNIKPASVPSPVETPKPSVQLRPTETQTAPTTSVVRSGEDASERVRFYGPENTYAEVYRMSGGKQRGRWSVALVDSDANEVVSIKTYPTKERALEEARTIEIPSVESTAPTTNAPRLGGEITETPVIEQVAAAAESGMTSAEVINRDFKDLEKRHGKRWTQKYFEQVDRLVNPNRNEVVEYRYAGPVVKRGDRYYLLPVTDTSLKEWRLSEWDPMDVTDQFTKQVAKQVAAPSELSRELTPKSGVIGKQTRAWIDPSQKFDMQYEVVELDDLVASHYPDGRINPNYPAEMQPRDRTQDASRAWVAEVSRPGKFDPDELLADTNAIERGAPIISEGNVVTSGNGRTMLLRAISPEQYQQYRNTLLAQLDQFGVSPDAVQGMRQPVLVRRQNPADDLTLAANTSATLTMNAAEQARILARQVTETDLAYLDMGSADNLRQALSQAGNREFVQRVLAKMPRNQRGALVDAEGFISAQGVDAIRSALFAKVFGDNRFVLENYVLNPVADLANIGNGLERAIGNLAIISERFPDMDIGEHLAKAAAELRQLRISGASVNERLAQLGMFDDMSPETKLLLPFLDANARSGKRIGDALSRYADTVLSRQGGETLTGATTAYSRTDTLKASLQAPEALTLFQGPAWGDALRRRMKFSKIDLTGMSGDSIDNWYDMLDWSDNTMRQSGNTAAPNMANGTAQSISDVEAAIRKVVDHLEGGRRPNTMTAQQAQALRKMADDLMPAYDETSQFAGKTAEAAANFAMLNFRDRRRIDSLMGVVFPFHFFWSRSAKNWAERLAGNTRLLNSMYEMDRAVQMENTQANVPEHLKGTLPIPGTDWRMANPINYMIPIGMYMGSNFHDPSEARSPAEAAWMGIRNFLPAPMPAIDIISNYMFDWLTPKEGAPRMGQYQAVDWMPLGKIAGLSYQAMTGKLPHKGFWGWDDEYSFGRIGKQIALDVMAGKADPQLGMWGLDNLHQYVNGVGAIPEDPRNADALVQSAAKTVGANRLATAMGGYLAFPIYHLSDEERKARAMRKQRQALAWDAETASGSRPAVVGFDAATGGVLKPYSAYYQLYPNSSADENVRPGIIAAAAAKRAETAPIYTAMQAAEDAAIKQNPNISPSELYDLTKPYWKQLDAIKERYPSLGGGYEPRAPYGANPTERAEWELRNLIEMTKPANKPTWPGDDADAVAKKDYYTSFGIWEDAHYAALDKAIKGQVSSWVDSGKKGEPWYSEFGIMTKGMKASDLIRTYDDMFFASEVEKRWMDYTARYQEWNQAQWDTRRANVVEVLGEDMADLVSQYLALPKGSDERVEFKSEHPEIDHGLLVSYNPAEYAAARDLFGDKEIGNFFAVRGDRPDWPGTDATPQEMKKYYAALDDFNRANPGYEEIDMWMYGRPSLDTEIPEGAQQAYYDLGKDWQEAKAIFGDDIFDLYIEAQTSQDYFGWLASHPQDSINVQGYASFRKAREQAAIIDEMQVNPVDFAQPTQAPAIPASFMPGTQPAPVPGTPPPPSVFPLAGTKQKLGFTPGAQYQMQRTTPVGETPEAPFPVDAQGWAMLNEKYAQWEGRKAAVAQKFGQDARVLYERYLNASPSQREEIKAQNPILRAIGIYTYNPKEYAEATKLFGDVWGEWVNVPPYNGTPASSELRSEYWRQHPAARELHVWLYGRYKKSDEETTNDETFSYNFGEDWQYAKDAFGEDIWRVYIAYNNKWDRATKRSYYDAHPTLSDFFKWWYQDQEDKPTVPYSGMWANYPFGGGGGGGGGYSRRGGGGGGGGSWSDRQWNYAPQIDARQISRELAPEEQAIPFRRWRPSWAPSDATELKTPTIRKWRPSW